MISRSALEKHDATWEVDPICARWLLCHPENAYIIRICMKTVFWYFFMPRALKMAGRTVVCRVCRLPAAALTGAGAPQVDAG